MADPVSLALIAGVALQAVGTLTKGESEARAAEFNADALSQQAAFTRQRTAAEEKRFRRTARKERGAFRTAAGSSLALGGSAADIFEDAIINQELDALNIRLQGQLEERALISGAAQQKTRAKGARFQAALGAGTSLLTSVSGGFQSGALGGGGGAASAASTGGAGF